MVLLKIEGGDIARLLTLLAIGRSELDEWYEAYENGTNFQASLDVAAELADTMVALVGHLTGIMHSPEAWE